MRRLSAALLGTLLLAAAAVVTASPAGAVEQPGIVLKPNQTVEVNHPAPIGGGNAYPIFGSGPDECSAGDASLYCDKIPLTLDVPNITRGFYSVAFVLSWPTENIVIPGTGTLPETQLGLGVWDDPIVEDDDAPLECDPESGDLDWYLCQILGPAGGEPGGDEAYVDTWLFNEQPIRFGLIPKRTKYSITVANYYGAVPEGYTLKVSLVAPDADALKDQSIEGPVDLSADAPSGATNDFGALTLPAQYQGFAGVPGLELGGFGLADFGPDTDLSRLGLNGDDNLELDRADIIRRAIGRDIRAPGDESAFFLWFWLVILPAVILAGAGVWLLRRRASLLGA